MPTAQKDLHGDADLLRQHPVFVDDELVPKINFVFSNALSRGIDVGLVIYEAQSSVKNEDVFWQWSLRIESLLERSSDIAKLYIDPHVTGDIVCMLSGEYGSLTKWHGLSTTNFQPSIFGSRRFVSKIIEPRLYKYQRPPTLNDQAVDPFLQAEASALNGLEKIRAVGRSLRGWQRLQNFTPDLQDLGIRSIKPWAVALLCRYPDTDNIIRVLV